MSEELELAVVGGGPAALSAARAYREAGGGGAVAIFAAEPHRPYERPPLTKGYLRGESGREELPLEPESWYAANAVVWRNAPITALDPRRAELETAAGERVRWRACVLATGASPALPPIAGGDLPGVMTVRAIEDSDRLRAAAADGRRVAVVGSGFIGCEAATSMAALGARVTVVSDERLPNERRLGPEAAARIAAWLEQAGVELATGDPVTAITARGDELAIETAAGSSAADTVLVATGVEPNVELAAAAGLELAEQGGIAVDAGLRTSAPNVWAAGDVACPLHPVAGRRLRVEHWGEALAHGVVAGGNAAGAAAKWRAAPGFWSTIGGRTLKHVGWGDGFDEASFEQRSDGSFAVSYRLDGELVGVLAHDWDEAYEEGRASLERGSADG